MKASRLIVEITTEEYLNLESICQVMNRKFGSNFSVTNYLQHMIQQELVMQKELENSLNSRSLQKKKVIASL